MGRSPVYACVRESVNNELVAKEERMKKDEPLEKQQHEEVFHRWLTIDTALLRP